MAGLELALNDIKICCFHQDILLKHKHHQVLETDRLRQKDSQKTCAHSLIDSAIVLEIKWPSTCGWARDGIQRR